MARFIRVSIDRRLHETSFLVEKTEKIARSSRESVRKFYTQLNSTQLNSTQLTRNISN